MSWGWVAPAISAASSIIGGMVSSNAASDDADRAAEYAQYNADQQIAWGQTQASLTMMSAAYNASNIRNQAEYNIAQQALLNEYNVDLAYETLAYNDALYDDEVDQIYDALDMESEQLHVDYVKARGATVAQQASSGTTIGVGSNKDVVIDMTAEEALFQLVLQNNADVEAASVLNSQAQGRWETEMSIQKLWYEGELSAASMRYTAGAEANAALFTGALNATLQIEGAENSAASILSTGSQTSSNLDSQASSYLTQGLLTGATTIASSYTKSDTDSVVNFTTENSNSGSKVVFAQPESVNLTGSTGLSGSLMTQE